MSNNLKDDSNYSNVFVVPDRSGSREERIEHRKLVDQLKLKISQDPHERFYIWKSINYLVRGLSYCDFSCLPLVPRIYAGQLLLAVF